MGPQAKIGEGLGGADQPETGLLVLGVVPAGVGLIEPAVQHANRASEIPPLLTEARQREAVPAGGGEDVLVLAD
jgi:hypothetical protein